MASAIHKFDFGVNTSVNEIPTTDWSKKSTEIPKIRKKLNLKDKNIYIKIKFK